MIEYLINLGISKNTIIGMLEMNPSIKELDKSYIENKIYVLKNIKCTNAQIIDIITSNSLFFNTSEEDNIKLFNYLHKLGFDNLNILFDSNPYILNLEIYEIENYVNNLLNKGIKLEDIVDELSSNTLLFNDM